MGTLRVLDASAGSGKTYSIVLDYLERCLKEPDSRVYRHILAITFTNKAASEMKSRILRALEQFSTGKVEGSDNIMFKKLMELLELDEQSLVQRSKILLHRILHDFARFDVGTIDQFTARIVRTFSQDLQLPAQFDISLDFKDLLDQAVHLLMDSVGEDEELTKHLKDFIEERIRNKESWKIERDILDVGSMLGENHHRQEMEGLLSMPMEELLRIYRSIRKERYVQEKIIREKAFGLISFLEVEGLRPSGMGQMSGWLLGLLKKISRIDEFDITKVQPSASIEAFLSGEKGLFGQRPTPEQRLVEPRTEDIRSRCRTELEELNEKIARYFSLQLVQKPFPGILVLKELDEVLKHYQEENRLIHISNFNRLIAEEIRDQAMPFIYERLGERYDHYYLDEFQDTSDLQWKNLFPLIQNALSEYGGSCLIVGDAKQAIYRWRGGKLEQFVRLTRGELPEQYLSESGLSSSIDIRNEVLKTNWRSKERIVSFVRRIFQENASLLEISDYKAIFEAIDQKAFQEEGGYIELFRPEDEEQTPDDQVLTWISNLRSRGYRNKDICILVKKNKEGGAMASLLAGEQIPVISGDSLLLSSSAEANALSNALCFLNQDSHDEARCRLLLYLQYRQGDALWNANEWESALRSSKDADDLIDRTFDLKIPFRQLSSLGLYEAAEHIQSAFELGHRNPAFIQLMMNSIDELENKKNIGLAEFEDWWVERQSRISLQEPENVDAVRIMTIHKSKGLEFPVVILPFANWLYRLDRRDTLWLDLDPDSWYGLSRTFVSPSSRMELMSDSFRRQFQEESERNLLDSLNVLYVALTRAEDELYIALPKNGQKGASVRDWFDDLMGENESLQLGKPMIRQESPSKAQEGINTYRSVDWRDRIRISKPAFRTDAMRRGEWVHDLLARFSNEDQLRRSIDVLKKRGELLDEEAKTLFDQIRTFLELPDFQAYFHTQSEIINERDLIDSAGMIHRPDRLLIHGNQVQIVDFKTGEEDPRHRDQVDQYAQILSEAGFQIRERVLLYLDKKKVVSW